MKKIIITGPESTGKTLLSQKLAGIFDGNLYPEIARGFVEKKGSYTKEDIVSIAQKQAQAYGSAKGAISIFDTHLIITKIWLLWHAGAYPKWIDDEIIKTRNDLYLICYPDIPWEADPVREHGGEERLQLFAEYLAELHNFGLSYFTVKGVGDHRIQLAINHVRKFLNE